MDRNVDNIGCLSRMRARRGEAGFASLTVKERTANSGYRPFRAWCKRCDSEQFSPTGLLAPELVDLPHHVRLRLVAEYEARRKHVVSLVDVRPKQINANYGRTIPYNCLELFGELRLVSNRVSDNVKLIGV